MTDTKCEFCGYYKLPVNGERTGAFTYCPNHHIKNVTDFKHEDIAIVEVEFVIKTDAM